MRISRALLSHLLLLTACSSAERDPATGTTSLADTVSDPAADAGVASGDDAAPVLDPTVLPDGLRYEQVQQTSIRAACMRGDVLFDKLVFDRVRSVELGTPGPSDPVTPGCPFGKPADGFAVLRAFHAAVPDHEVVTIWIEDDAATALSPADFDAQLATALGREVVFAPRDFVARCTGAATLRDAVAACRWPTLNELRGKMLVVRTGAASALDAYVAGGTQANDRLAFVAPDLVAASRRGRAPDSGPPYVLFSDRQGPPLSEKPMLDAMPEIVVRNDAHGSADAWLAMKQEGLHHIVSSTVDAAAHPSITTVTPRGSVFTCRGGANGCQGRVEASDAITMEVTTGDIAGVSDSFVFEYQTNSSPGTTWSAYAGGSAPETRAKGCLMARASLDADAPYFAVCRLPGSKSIRVQFREQKGGRSRSVEVPDDPGTPTFLQLATADAEGPNCFSGALTSPGADALPIGATTCFSVALPLQGIASSSNGASEAKLVFANVQRSIALPSAPAVAAPRLNGATPQALTITGNVQIDSFRGFPATTAVGASATASAGTCSISFAGLQPDGTYPAWETVGQLFSLGGTGDTSATAPMLTIDAQGNLIATGTAKGPNGYEWVTRRGSPDGATWTTTDHFQDSGTDTLGGQTAVFNPANGGASTLVTTGGAAFWTPTPTALVRTSTDDGSTWSASGVGATGTTGGCNPFIDGSGATPMLYVGCADTDGPGHTGIAVRRRALGDTVWQPVDKFSWPFSWGADLNEIAMDSNGSLFEIGRTAGGPAGGQNTALVIRRKLSDKVHIGSPFLPVDNFQLSIGHDANPGSFAEDKVRHILYVSGVAEDADGTSYGYVRRSKPAVGTTSPISGAAGTWETVGKFQLVPGQYTQFIGIGVDHAGNVYVGGSATDTDGRTHWLVRASTDHGDSWVTTDVFVPEPDSQGFAISHFIEGLDGSMYVAGTIGKLGATGWNSSSWVVRRSLCR